MGRYSHCPVCGQKRTHIGLTSKWAGGSFLLPKFWVGFEVIRKCEAGHYWTKSWHTVSRKPNHSTK